MKKIALALACSTLSGLALADTVTLFNKSADYTMSVDYQICKAGPGANNEGFKFECGSVTNVEINSAKVSPGKNFVQITVPKPAYDSESVEVSVTRAAEKNNGQIVAQTQFNKSSLGESSCNVDAPGFAGILDDLNGSPFVVCTVARI